MQRSKKLISALLLVLCLSLVISPVFVKADDYSLFDLFDDIDDTFYDDDYDDDYYNDDSSETGKISSDLPAADSKNNSSAGLETKKNSANGYQAGVYDGAGLFSQSEGTALLNEAYKYTEYGDIYVVTTKENSYGSSESATDKYCDNFYQQYSRKSNCVIFIIDMYTRYLYIYSKGSVVEDNLTSSKANSITDNIYSYASDKEYYQCASKALDQIGKVLAGMRIAQPMKVVSNLFIAFVCGFVIMYLVALGKSKASKPSDEELLKYVARNFNYANPKDIVTGTTKTYCPRSSGSGGGRSGGGGGGHSGGGHRF